MDKSARATAVHRSEEAEWPKKRTLLIGARDFQDYYNAERIVRGFREEVRKHDIKPGRHNVIGYALKAEIPGGHGATKIVGSISVWYTASQITLHFNHED